jgi:hypothetical protein
MARLTGAEHEHDTQAAPRPRIRSARVFCAVMRIILAVGHRGPDGRRPEPGHLLRHPGRVRDSRLDLADPLLRAALRRRLGVAVGRPPRASCAAPVEALRIGAGQRLEATVRRPGMLAD